LAGAIGGLGQFAMVMTLLLPLALPLNDQQPSGPAGTVDMPMSTAIREAFNHRGFWLLNLGFLACGFQLAFVATHLSAYLPHCSDSSSAAISWERFSVCGWAATFLKQQNRMTLFAAEADGYHFERAYQWN